MDSGSLLLPGTGSLAKSPKLIQGVCTAGKIAKAARMAYHGVSASISLGKLVSELSSENFEVAKVAGYGGQAVVHLVGMRAAAKTPTGCFGAGTKLRTPHGDKPIEDFKPDDWLLAQSEDDPEGKAEPRRVEEVFRPGHF